MTSVAAGYPTGEPRPMAAATSRGIGVGGSGRTMLGVPSVRLVEVFSVASVAAAVATSVGWPTVAADLALPFAILAVLVGIPHGAVDGAILATARPAAGRLAGWAYLGVFVVVGAGVWLATVPAVLVLLLLAVVHFGLGEVEYGDATAAGSWRGSSRQGWSWQRAAAVVGYGGVVVAVPFAVHPKPVDAVLRALDPALSTALPPGIRWVAAALSVACLIVTIALQVRSGRLQNAGEGLLLLVMAVVAPPVLTFAVFFGAWHSARHLARVLRSRTTANLGAGEPATAQRLDRRVVVWPAAGSVAAVAAVAGVLACSGVGLVRLLAVLVAGLLALTVPHAAVVAWFDHRRKVSST